MRTGFNKSTVTSARAIGFDASKEAGVFITPHNHATAVAALRGVSRNARVSSNDCAIGLRSIRRVAAQVIATDANVAAAGCAICVYKRVAKQAHSVAEQINGSALFRAA